MKIQSRIAILLSLVILVTVITVMILSMTILRGAFTDIENSLVIESANGLNHELDRTISTLDNSAKDWARWDESYEYIIGQNDSFINDEIDGGTFMNLEINGIIILDGFDIKYSQFYDYRNNAPLNLSEKAQQDIIEYIGQYRGNFTVKGLIMVDGRLVAFAAQDITNSDGSMRTNGSMIFAKYVYDDELMKSVSNLGQKFKTEASKEIVPARYPDAVEISPNIYKLLRNDDLECIVQLRDILGNPVGTINLDIERKAYNTYSHAITLYVISFIVILFLINMVFFIIVKKGVLDKIKTVENDINRIIIDETPSRKISKINIVADEEITSLMNNFNKLTSMLENDRNEVSKKNVALEEANKSLKKLDELKDNFLSNVSHEIRTPLTSLKSYTQLLLSGSFGKLNRSQEENVKIVLESILQLEHLVNDLLDVSKFESSRMIMHPEKCDINRIIKDTSKEFDPLIKKLDGRIILKIDSKHKNITVDKDRIKQLVRNILSNAVKYHSERKLKIIISTHLEEKNLMISFEDTGIGISKADMKHLFEKFYQVDQGMKRKVGGSGLGLVIIKQIARAHHGNVHIESMPDKGTTVYVQLPYR